MRISIATDAWAPQVNGVVRTLSMTVNQLLERGFEVELITPDQFFTVPMPGYREIKLAVAPRFGARKALNAFQPDIVHVSTEGPIGWSARSWCLSHDVPFTTCFHTRFPDYAAVRTGLSSDRFWMPLRRFHRRSHMVLAATRSLAKELAQHGIEHCHLWSRGVDTQIFNAAGPTLPELETLHRPILLNVGRVSQEKNLDAFLGKSISGSKVIVGDGPQLEELKARYPDAVFLGALHGERLASAYRSADVFVFPSLTDTFGLVLIEALACGTPVAAYPVPGPLDIINHHGLGPFSELPMPVGALDHDLSRAISRALSVNRRDSAAYGKSFCWENSTDQFVAAQRIALDRFARKRLSIKTADYVA